MNEGTTAALDGGIAPPTAATAFAEPGNSAGVGAGTGAAAENSGPAASASGLASVRLDGVDSLMAAATPGSDGYKVGPQDVLEVSVYKVPELSRSVQVADVGSINLPLLGEVEVAGQTPRDIERMLTQKLGDKYLQSPQVTVFVKEYNSRRVTIEGAVKKPGVYPIRGRTTLLQFISMAAGVTEAAATDEIIVFRQDKGQKSAARFDLDAIREGRAADLEIRDGDMIVVNTSTTKAVYNNVLRVLPVAARFLILL